MISCVNETEKGTPSKRSIEFIKSLERNINVSEKTVHLFATNFQTKLFNHDRLTAMAGEVKLYRSTDEGDSYYLNRFQAAPVLGLKLHCPVMFVVNLSDTLVNGTMGVVSALREDQIDVHFIKLNQTVTLTRHLFVKIDPVSRRTLAKRLQFPLILSFGMTIHKSQGMTLESVVVDCEGAKIPGQIGVTLGRVISSTNLQVKNVKPSLVTEHPFPVKHFYDTESKKISLDSSCCRSEYISLKVRQDLFSPFDIDDGLFDDDDDDDDDVVVVVDDSSTVGDDGQILREAAGPVLDDILATEKPVPLPEYINPIDILNDVLAEFDDTPMEKSMKLLYNSIVQNMRPCSLWIISQFLTINKLLNDNISDATLTQSKNMINFFSDINKFLKSEKFFTSCKAFFSEYGDNLEKVGQFLCTSICFHLQNIVTEKKSQCINTEELQERTTPTENFEEG